MPGSGQLVSGNWLGMGPGWSTPAAQLDRPEASPVFQPETLTVPAGERG